MSSWRDQNDMQEFIFATLTQTEPGAIYEDMIIDRWLVITHETGKTLRVFDMDNISRDLKAGTKYEFVLCPLIYKGVITPYLPEMVSTSEQGLLATILDRDYSLEEGDFEFTVDGLSESKWALVQSELGGLVISQHDLDKHGVIGQAIILDWQRSRLDLLAVR